MTNRLAVFGLLASCALLVVLVHLISAAALLRLSVTIADSAPSATTTYTIQFETTEAIPPSGRIVITPQPGHFTIPTGFAYDDVDFAVGSGEPLTDRSLAAIASVSEDGVTVVTGTNGAITIRLNSSTGVASGEKVHIELGTHAAYGPTGNQSLLNPATVGGYPIDVLTRDAAGASLDHGQAMIAVVQPVGVTAKSENVPPTRSNGLPSGTVAAGNEDIEISLQTDEIAVCRYATSTDVQYSDMTGTFTGVGGILHITTLDGFQNSTSYSYFVRCQDLFGANNLDDYEITFALDAVPISDTSIVLPSETSPGPVPNGSDFLHLSNINFAGLAPPQSTVTVLKDGVYATQSQTNSIGAFTASLTGLERGVYTFLIYATDSASRKSASVASTLTLGQGTSNSISSLLVPPTIELSSEALEVAADVRVFGAGLRGSTIELALRTSGEKKYTTTIASTSANGAWEITVPSKDLSRGTQTLRASGLIGGRASGNSTEVTLTVGGVTASSGVTGDINGDGKVNLVDFSIFLLNWNTSNEESDFNDDGTVNLADFSILLFNWTG